MFSPFLFQTTTNASLLTLQNAINPLNQSHRTIPHTVDSNGSALNTPGIQVFFIFVIKEKAKIKLGLHDKSHAHLVSKAGQTITTIYGLSEFVLL